MQDTKIEKTTFAHNTEYFILCAGYQRPPHRISNSSKSPNLNLSPEQFPLLINEVQDHAGQYFNLRAQIWPCGKHHD